MTDFDHKIWDDFQSSFPASGYTFHFKQTKEGVFRSFQEENFYLIVSQRLRKVGSWGFIPHYM
jgi:hypothetical protein